MKIKQAVYIAIRGLIYIPLLLAGLVAGLITIAAALFLGLMVQQ